jgi:exopolyphosphatase/guanosine-5'-triphosphate,3'-diphosphate pyrophosphatase
MSSTLATIRPGATAIASAFRAGRMIALGGVVGRPPGGLSHRFDDLAYGGRTMSTDASPESTEPTQSHGPKRAAIDLGSNMVRCTVGRRRRDGELEILDRFVAVPRLADGLGSSGGLNDAAIERTSRALADHAHRAREAGVASIDVVATGALRLASNGEAARRALEQSSGLSIRVIDGQTEARFALAGVRTHVGEHADLALIDVGGSSTECIVARGTAIDAVSLNVGVITLSEWVNERDEARRAIALCARARQEVARVRLPAIGATLPCFATGGAAVALAAYRRGARYLEFVPGDDDGLASSDLETIFARFASAPLAERARTLHISPEHCDLVPAGFAILTAVLADTRAPRILPTMRGVAEGLLHDVSRGDRE